jgi:hypothetical protein
MKMSLFMTLSSPYLFRACLVIFIFHTILTRQIQLCSDGSYPTVTSHSGEWSLDPASHSLAWSIPVVTAHDDSKTGSLIFNVGGVDVSAFFPVDVSFLGQGSLAGVTVASVNRVDGAEGPEYSVDALVTADEYLVV